MIVRDYNIERQRTRVIHSPPLHQHLQHMLSASCFLIHLLVGLLALARGSLGEFCVQNTFKYCPYYCCGYSSNEYCCTTCALSVKSHPECYSVDVPVATIVGSIISFIVFVVIVSIIVAICCGCICSARTGIQRRGRVIRPGDATVTVITTDHAGYPPQHVVYPQGGYGTGYPTPVQQQQPPQAGYPPKQAVYPAQAAPPPYPAGTGYGGPPVYNAGYVPEHK